MAMLQDQQTQASGPITISAPESADGAPVHDLIAACPPLDTNSRYLNLLQCSHFADTCAIARRGDEVVGFLSAYLIPNRPDTLFVWQVAVSSEARGQGLAKRLLMDVLSRPFCSGVRRLEATITEDNEGSWALFTSLAKSLKAAEERSPIFDKQVHFAGKHDTEYLISIGPFDPIS